MVLGILFLSLTGFGQEKGNASYYPNYFKGQKTASGELYHPDSLTAAHPTMAFQTKVKVTNLNNHKSVIVRINDRGPFIEGRIIDLSGAAARKLNFIERGVTRVKLKVIEEPRE